MPRRNESPLEFLLKLPWWISATLGVLAFIGLHWGLPVWAGDVSARQMIAKGFAPLAPLPLLFFGIAAIGSYVFGRKRRRLVDQQTSLESLRQTSWKDFEILVAEAYRRQGYQVEYSLGQGADGGVDIVLRKADRTSLVQCKQWKVYSVGAPVIREMFGLMTAERADEAIIVTSGKFTRDAQTFAAGKPIRLIDGPQLLALVQSVQTHAATTATPSAEVGADTACPRAANPWCSASRNAAPTPATSSGAAPPIPPAKALANTSPKTHDRYTVRLVFPAAWRTLDKSTSGLHRHTSICA